MTKAAAEEQVSHLPDADMQAVPRALTRAAQRAREIAKQTGTELVVRDITVEAVVEKDDPSDVD
jgi:hypothetical protein